MSRSSAESWPLRLWEFWNGRWLSSSAWAISLPRTAITDWSGRSVRHWRRHEPAAASGVAGDAEIGGLSHHIGHDSCWTEGDSRPPGAIDVSRAPSLLTHRVLGVAYRAESR